MVNFVTYWKTASGNLPTATENDVAQYHLEAVQYANFMGNNQTTIDLGDQYIINSLSINGQITNDYTVVGESLIFGNAPSKTDIIEIITDTPITYTKLHGTLPVGLSLSTTGELSGIIGTLPASNDDSNVVYTFGVRASDGKTKSDRIFIIEVERVSVAVSPPEWGNLPAQQSYEGLFNYIPIGRSSKGAKFEYTIDIFRPSGLMPNLLVEPITEVDQPFNEIPSNLTVENSGLVTGRISGDIPLGEYFFKVTMLDSDNNPIMVGSAKFPKIFMINVSPPINVLQPLRFIKWKTSAGSLGQLNELTKSPFFIKAESTTSEKVLYKLKSGSRLPFGLTLNSSNGNIEGTTTHVGADTTFTFTIVAYIPNTDISSEREFSIKILSKYNTSEIINIYLNLQVDKFEKIRDYCSNFIDESLYFRPTDTNFGDLSTKNNFSMLLVGGISSNISDMQSFIYAMGYHAPLKLMLGKYKYATAKLNNKIIYEVIYREVIDPNENAGGFKLTNNIPVRDDVIYPQDNNVILYPTSINNLRYNFITNKNFPTNSTALRMNVGKDTIENIPLWMTSKQDDDSILGYVSGFEIATVIPGAAEEIVANLNNRTNEIIDPIAYTGSSLSSPNTTHPDIMIEENPINENHVVYFDQMYVEYMNISAPTTFDDMTTTFDSQTTTFDSFYFYDGKLVRMSR